MNKRSLLKLFISAIVSVTASSCANRPYFVIENETEEAVEVELVRDSINLPDIVATEIIDKKPYNGKYFYKWDDPSVDSLKRALVAGRDKAYFINYLYDSLSLRSLLHNTWNSPMLVNEFTIEPIGDNTADVNYDQNAFEYYHRDSALIKKILDEHTVTIFIPSRYLLSRECLAGGDCSCSAESAFPDVKELRIKPKSGRNVVLTKANLQSMVSKERFHSQSNSLVYEIE